MTCIVRTVIGVPPLVHSALNRVIRKGFHRSLFPGADPEHLAPLRLNRMLFLQC